MVSKIITDKSESAVEREIYDIADQAAPALCEIVEKSGKTLDELFAMIVVVDGEIITTVIDCARKPQMLEELRARFAGDDPGRKNFRETLLRCVEEIDYTKSEGLLRALVTYVTPRNTEGFASLRVQIHEGSHT